MTYTLIVDNIQTRKLESQEMLRIYREEFGAPKIPKTVFEIEPFVQYLFYRAGINTEWKFRSLSNEQARIVRIQMHYNLNWANCGFPVFNLTHSLAAKLLLTDCRGIKGRDLRWPFPSFCVGVPQPSDFIQYSGENNKPVSVNHILFHSFELALDENESGKVPGFLEGRINLDQIKTVSSFFTGLQGPHSPLVHRTVEAPNDDDGIEQFLSEFTNPLTAKQVDKELTFSDLDGTAMKSSLRLMTNLSLYLRDLQIKGDWSPVPIKNKGKKFKGKPTKTWTLGNEIKISPELRRIASNALVGPRWRIRARFLVRGHWRRYKVGAGRQKTELRWIEPFWKGPKEGEVLDRLYEIQDGK